MKQLVILSGKGGTGKTTVAAALADIAAKYYKLVLTDADVDASNLELLLSPRIDETHDFWGGKLAIIESSACCGCGICKNNCRFSAITMSNDVATIDPLACEGCGACYYVCPNQAITMKDQLCGHWFRSQTDIGALFHARLNPGAENSGKLVTQVRMSSITHALKTNSDLIIVDGPPGIGCAAIAAVTGANAALLVVEPSVSGIHDLQRASTMLGHFNIAIYACLNKADLNQNQVHEIEIFCSKENILFLGCIPFDIQVVEAMVKGIPITKDANSPAINALYSIWQQLQALFLSTQPYNT